MLNEIPITLRIPVELDSELKRLSKALGFTKTNLIRLAIHEKMSDVDFHDTSIESTKTHRLVLNVNAPTLELLQNTAQQKGVSINRVVVVACLRSVEHYSKLLSALDH